MFYINGIIGNIINAFGTYLQIAFQKKYINLYPYHNVTRVPRVFFPFNTLCY